jgi:hypothetical protein
MLRPTLRSHPPELAATGRLAATCDTHVRADPARAGTRTCARVQMSPPARGGGQKAGAREVPSADAAWARCGRELELGFRSPRCG